VTNSKARFLRAFLYTTMNAIYTQKELFELACTSHGGSLSVDTVEEAIQFCKNLASSHYENFPVASFLLPSSVRDSVAIVYAFSRVADDIADEYVLEYGSDKADHALSLMHHFALLTQTGAYTGSNPLWLGMKYMFAKTGLIFEPFERLLNAFMQDVHFTAHLSLADTYEYCSKSANPIGELILRLHGYWDPKSKTSSDALCTALQMTNFLQDMSVDREKGRLYIPHSGSHHDDHVENYLANGEISPNFSKSIACFIEETQKQFNIGQKIVTKVPSFRFRCELLLIVISGLRIFGKCKKLSSDLSFFRPKLTILDYAVIFINFSIRIPSIIFIR